MLRLQQRTMHRATLKEVDHRTAETGNQPTVKIVKFLYDKGGTQTSLRGLGKKGVTLNLSSEGYGGVQKLRGEVWVQAQGFTQPMAQK